MADDAIRILISSRDNATLDLDKLKATVDELKAKRATITIDVKDAAAVAKIAAFDAALDRLDRRINSPRFNVQSRGLSARASALGLASGLGSLGGSGGNALTSPLAAGGLGPLPAALSSPLGLAGVAGVGVPAVGALVVEVGALAAGLTAAAAGVGAFGAVALPTFTSLKTGLTSLSAATDNYQAASANLDTAIRKSPADMKLYQQTIHGLEPDLQNAAKLLTNQNATWQSLSPSMQKSVVALANNKDALKLLLPDQKTALSALLAEKKAWDDLTPAQQKASAGLSQLGASYSKITAALQPTVMKVFNDGLKVAVSLLPALKPLAQAGGTAIDGLLKSLLKFTQSGGFKDWLAHFSTLVGPAITAIGKGVGQVALALGQLFTKFSARDVAHAIAIAFDTIAGTIRAVIYVVGQLMHAWDLLQVAALETAAIILGAFKKIADGVLTAVSGAVHAARVALDAVGLHMLDGADNALRGFKASVDKNLTGAINGIKTQLNNLSKVKAEAKITANIADLQKKLATAKAELNNPDVNGSRPKVAKVKADISNLEAQIAKAKSDLASVKNKKVIIGAVWAGQAAVNAAINAFNSIGGGARGAQANVRVQGHGGITGAASGGIRSNMTLVGEYGRELVSLPPGSQVHSNPDTERMLSQDGGSMAWAAALIAEVRNMNGALTGLLTRQNSITAGVPDGLAQTLNGAARSAAYRALYSTRG